jgi:hypothetical protein
MTITITINCDGQALDDGQTIELVRILRQLTTHAETVLYIASLAGYPLRDANGNTVGRVAVTE